MIILLKKIKNQTEYPWSELDLYNEVLNNPDNYELIKIKERIEKRQIGIDDIPKKGTILVYQDNEWYSLFPLELKEYPELEQKGTAIIIEKVDNIYLLDNNQVELKIGKYIINEKSNKKDLVTNVKIKTKC